MIEITKIKFGNVAGQIGIGMILTHKGTERRDKVWHALTEDQINEFIALIQDRPARIDWDDDCDACQ